MAAPSNFPTDLPERTQAPSGGGHSWKDRNCPNARGCWSFSLSSYSLKTSDKVILARRICMLAILGVRTALSILSIIWEAWGRRIVSFVLGSILAVLGFFFIAWCLVQIGDAKGYRKVLGMRIVSYSFLVDMLRRNSLLTSSRGGGTLISSCCFVRSFMLDC